MSWQGNVTQEQQVVRAFLAMPPCPVKEALGRLVLQVAFQVENLRCAQAQADGLPCQELEPDCATCQGLQERLRRCLEAEAFSA